MTIHKAVTEMILCESNTEKLQDMALALYTKSEVLERRIKHITTKYERRIDEMSKLQK